MPINIITNGLLLTPEMVDRLIPFGLNGIKITLDGDRDTHNQMRPLRGGQGTFDKIIDNVRAGRRPDAGSRSAATSTRRSADSYPALLDFLARAGFRADKSEQGQLQAGHPRDEAGRGRRA